MDYEQLKKTIAEKVANKSMTMEEGEDALLRFLVDEQQQPEDYSLQTQGTFLEELVAGKPLTSPAQSAPTEDLQSVLTGQANPLMKDKASTELEARNDLAEKPFLEAIADPLFWERNAKAAVKGPTQMVNGMVNGIPALAGLALDQAGVPKAGEFAEKQLDDFAEINQGLNDVVGSSDPIRPEESFMESLVGAVTPGGLVAKAVGVGVDFTVDQTVRELTDTEATDYDTAFDRIGLTNDGEAPVLGPLAAIGATLVAGSLGTSAVTRLVNKRHMSAVARPLTDIDPTAPQGLMTTEKAADLTLANTVDEQHALRVMLARDGLGNFEDVSNRIEFETHAAARTRAQEGIRTGKLTTMDATFEVPVAPKVLYEGYQGLKEPVRQDVSDYVNLLDMIDDAKIALEAGTEGNHGRTIAMLQRQLNVIEQRTPLAKQFSRDYRSITSGLRDFAEGSLFGKEHRQKLDVERPNYVPLEISNVDTSAPFMQRMKQAQQEDLPLANPEWFLQKRESAGNYDLATRADPFDMLMQYSESVMLARMKNDTKLAAIDGLLESDLGSSTIRLAEKNEAGLFNERTISVIRNGNKETYLTSKLKADLLKFDPYIAKYPAMFAIKRLAENAMVGPLSITFAPTTFLRDTVGGMVTRAEGTVPATLYQSAEAIPKILWAKAKGKLATSWQAKMMSGENGLPEGLMSAPAQKAFAEAVGDSYVNSLYHQMNMSGGFDASLMTNKIRAGTETFQEIKRSLVTSPVINNPVMNNLVTRFGAKGVGNMLDGFVALFNSMQDAPRYAAIEQTIKQTGMNVDDATALGKQLTGDVSKTGRVYRPDGVRMDVDAVDQGVLNLINKPIGQVTEVLRETTPFFNPMVQGLNKLKNSFAEDPIGTNLRAWKTVGIPAVAAYGWNEMLGQEYNDYAMERRSSRDVAMNMYVGIPGRPPEEGLEIPIMHELLFYGAPFSRSLHSIARSEEPDLTSRSMQILTQEMLSNSLDVGFPIAGSVLSNLQGVEGADSLIKPTKDVYLLRDDGVGFLPENVEAIVRTMFASAGDTAIELAYSLTQPDGEFAFNDFIDTTLNSVVRRAPIVKNVAGKKRANIHFSIPAKIKAEKYQAYTQARKYWDEFYNPKRKTTNEFDKPASKGGLTSIGNYAGDVELGEDLPFMMIGPEPLVKPENPYIEAFGEVLAENLGRNAAGMSGLRDRESQYGKIVRQISKYGKADQAKIAQWYDRLMSTSDLDEAESGVKELLEKHQIDLNDYDSRTKLVNLLEIERSKVIAAQLNVIQQVEDQFTETLRGQGVLKADESFNISKHLNPSDKDPFKKN